MLLLGLEFCLNEFNGFTQYVVRIETLMRGFCQKGTLSGGDFVWRGFCLEGILSGGRFCPGFTLACVHRRHDGSPYERPWIRLWLGSVLGLIQSSINLINELDSI